MLITIMTNFNTIKGAVSGRATVPFNKIIKDGNSHRARSRVWLAHLLYLCICVFFTILVLDFLCGVASWVVKFICILIQDVGCFCRVYCLFGNDCLRYLFCNTLTCLEKISPFRSVRYVLTSASRSLDKTSSVG